MPSENMELAWGESYRRKFALVEHCYEKAVDARHLLGSDGLVALLRREGYTVEPIKR